MNVRYSVLVSLLSVFTMATAYLLGTYVFAPVLIWLVEWFQTNDTPDWSIAAMVMCGSGFGAIVILALDD